MSIIDFHCHIYPQKIAAKAVSSVGDFYNIEMAVSEAPVEKLFEVAKGSGIDTFVVHSVAVTPNTVRSINDFIAKQQSEHEELIGFGTIHPDSDDPAAEIERMIKLGLKGVKIHPDTQKFDMDCPKMMEIYALIEGRLPIIVHTGDYRYDYSHPRRMAHIIDELPDLVVDAAHFGGWSIFDIGMDHLLDRDCYMDISSSMSFLGARRTRELIDIYGADRLLFGSDFPMWNPSQELERFKALGLPKIDEEKILYQNAAQILDL
jgi:uncharacterized protein